MLVQSLRYELSLTVINRSLWTLSIRVSYIVLWLELKRVFSWLEDIIQHHRITRVIFENLAALDVDAAWCLATFSPIHSVLGVFQLNPLWSLISHLLVGHLAANVIPLGTSRCDVWFAPLLLQSDCKSTIRIICEPQAVLTEEVAASAWLLKTFWWRLEMRSVLLPSQILLRVVPWHYALLRVRTILSWRFQECIKCVIVNFTTTLWINRSIRRSLIGSDSWSVRWDMTLLSEINLALFVVLDCPLNLPLLPTIYHLSFSLNFLLLFFHDLYPLLSFSLCFCLLDSSLLALFVHYFFEMMFHF